MAVNTSKFPDVLIAAINDWQAGSKDKEKKAKRLKELVTGLPSKFKKSPVVFRQLRVNGKLASGIAADLVPDAVSSWTTEKTVAERFCDDGDRNKVMVIFARIPNEGDVILNLNAVYGHPDFDDTVQSAKQRQKKEFHAIKRWGNDQCEVVLDETVMKNDQIVSVGAYRKLEDAIPVIGIPSPSAPTDDEIMNTLTLTTSNVHFWTSHESAQNGVGAAATKIRDLLATRLHWANTENKIS